MVRCNKCVLPESMPGITFDQAGICNYCNGYNKITYLGEELLLNRLNKFRDKRKKYDVMITLSGGRDSTYTLIKAVEDYSLRVLAITYENPFTHPVASLNINNIIKLYGIDHIHFRLNNDLHKKCFKNNIKQWLNKPLPSLIGFMCIACKSMWLYFLKMARAHHLNCIISGGNLFEESYIKRSLLGVRPQEPPETAFIKYINIIIKELKSIMPYINYNTLLPFLKGYFFGNPYAIGSRIWGYGVTKIDLFYFIEWNEKQIIDRIKAEVDWEIPQDCASTWRFDCKLSLLRNFLFKITLNMTEEDDFLSKIVREGVIKREEALKRLEKYDEMNVKLLYHLFRELRMESCFMNLMRLYQARFC
jgi:hypothetical protein